MFANVSVDLPPTFLTGVVLTVVYAVLATVFLLGGFKLFDWLCPRVDFQESMRTNPMACAVVVAAYFLALSHMLAQVIH